MIANTTQFYDAVRSGLFGGRMTQAQVNGINAILTYYKARYSDLESLAYILATAYHETNRSMAPVREGFAKTNAEAIRHVTIQLFNKGKIKTNYALPEANGQSYYGRGLVQLTWGYNYRNAGKNLGLDLYGNPDLLLQLDVSVRVLVEGMVGGWFTGKKLADYFLGPKADPYNARRIINGLDKAQLIASYYTVFLDALT